MNNTPINNPVLRSITNEMILLQYNLSVKHFNLNSSLIYYINNWNLLPLICLLSGCHFYRERFAERGFFYKVPDVLRDYLSAIPLEINEKARYKPGIANYHNIITCGFSTLLPYIRQQPLAMQQRFNLLFPDFVDKSIWNVHITFHDDKRFVFFTDQFIAEFSPQEFVDNCEQYLINNHCFSPDKVNEICEQARHYLVEKMFETHSLDMNNSVLASPEDL